MQHRLLPRKLSIVELVWWRSHLGQGLPSRAAHQRSPPRTARCAAAQRGTGGERMGASRSASRHSHVFPAASHRPRWSESPPSCWRPPTTTPPPLRPGARCPRSACNHHADGRQRSGGRRERLLWQRHQYVPRRRACPPPLLRAAPPPAPAAQRLPRAARGGGYGQVGPPAKPSDRRRRGGWRTALARPPTPSPGSPLPAPAAPLPWS